MSKHTPGPWRYRIATGTADTMISSPSAKEAVAVIPFRYGSLERRAANRALIITAPSMHAELSNVLEWSDSLRAAQGGVGGLPDWLEARVRAAIDAAEGR